MMSVGILKKMTNDNTKIRHELLSEALLGYRNFKRDSTSVSPYSLTYEHDALISMEIVVPLLKVARQTQAIMIKLANLDEERIIAFGKTVVKKKSVARAYNKRVKKKSFQEEEMVWKIVLHKGTEDRELGKWSPN